VNLPFELRSIGRRLGEDLRDRVVFVGGMIRGLLVKDPAAGPARPTRDVDLIVDVPSHAKYVQLTETLRSRGFRESTDPDAPICRWTVDGIPTDITPVDPGILGFSFAEPGERPLSSRRRFRCRAARLRSHDEGHLLVNLYRIQIMSALPPARLNILMDRKLYRRLKEELPPRKISAFVEASVRARLAPDRRTLERAYKAARKEKWRHQLAAEWASLNGEGWPS
jgi:hypothetical protein